MILSSIINVIIIYLIAILAIAFYTLLERKILGYAQLRKGPNKVGIMGLPQPFADALKLFTKEQTKPTFANSLPYIAAPIFSLILALLLWTLYPYPFSAYFLPLGLLFFLCVSRVNVYTILGAGWASNSKYSLLGALRAVAQTISYEVRIIFILLPAPIFFLSFDFRKINQTRWTWPLIILPPIFFIWTISLLAETNRTPFDLAEGESELVSGFNVEYRAGRFALIFIAEYANILVISVISVALFIGICISWPTISSIIIILASSYVAFFFIWARGTLPRIRYDQLINLTWKIFLPIALINLIILMPLISFLYIEKL